MRQSIWALLALLTVLPLHADEGFILGATTSSGVMYSKKDHEAISMNREIIDFKGFLQTHTKEYQPAAVASYNVLFEFENTSGNYHQVDCGFPIQINFTHFDPQYRVSFLDALTELFPDEFNMSGSKDDILRRLRAQFDSTIFIRKFINRYQLYLFHTTISITQDDRDVPIDQVMAEFRLIDDDRGNKRSVLSMQLHVLHKLSFTPRQKSVVIVRYNTPAFNMGYDGYNFYAPYVLGTGATWKGDIQAIYVLNRPHESSLAVPYYLDYTCSDFDYDKRLTVINGHEPESYEKIGFFAVRNGNCGCSKEAGLREAVGLPWALKSFSASSSMSATSVIQGACYTTSQGTSVARWIPDFDMGFNDRLVVVGELAATDSSNTVRILTIAENQCSGEEALVELKKAYDPVWAFDIGPDTLSFQGIGQPGHFAQQTAWCEGVKGRGEGQYLQFDISQPISTIRVYHGNQRNDAMYKASSRPKTMNLVDARSGKSLKVMSFWDFRTSSSFELETPQSKYLPAGSYKLVISETYPGSDNDDVCISGVYFQFVVEDAWLLEHYTRMREPAGLRAIHIGMTRARVVDLLGPPVSTSTVLDDRGPMEILEYPLGKVYILADAVESVILTK